MKPDNLRDDRSFTAWNEEMVKRYDIDRYYERSHPIVRWIERKRIDALRSFADARSGDRVLEVGCGAGHVLNEFADTNRTGIDLSSTMLDRARRRLGHSVRLLRGSAEALPFANQSYDVVLCTEVLEHTRQPEQVMRELMRVAAPGGRVVVSIPNEANIDRAKRFIRSVPILRTVLRSLASEGNEWHVHQMDLNTLRTIGGGPEAVARLQGIPIGFLPVRYVALMKTAQS